MTIFRKIYASITLCKDDFEQKRLLKDSVHEKVCKNDPVFLHSRLVKITLQKMTAQRLVCAKMTL